MSWAEGENAERHDQAGSARVPQEPGEVPDRAGLVPMTALSPPKRRGLAVVLAAAGLAVAVVAGAVAWAAGSSGGPNLQPVDQALAGLASTPGLD